ncbi:MAG: ABC transporter ATP-binding protein [Flavobacteriaceae bacterium]|jgi:lipopolysaccharide transport system ATP-binding protein|nr:ABC transporter ATP-binding protein [Flavobacteriaceae bacterium]
MSNIVLDIENVSKQYRLGEVGTGTLSHDLNRWWASVRGKENPYLKIGDTNDRTKKGDSDYVWALRDIDFKVEQGQAVGIIGRNGAGKSTLLKLLSRVTKPTTGTIKYKGRIASLLEVGTGFHPEMTGRENIYLNGAILGMTRKEISRKFDEIVDFAGVERYVDTPVKRYSSGMYVRLAFAVAAHLESEILIVDEVLAVGDAEFQKKCIGKMGDVSKGEGRTILFVSHNMASVKSLCDRGILMQNGNIVMDTDVNSVVEQYFAYNIGEEFNRLNFTPEKGQFLESISIKSNLQNVIESGENLRFELKLKNPTSNLLIDIGLYNTQDEKIFNLSTSYFDVDTKRDKINCIFKNNLVEGNYYVNLLITDSDKREHYSKCLMFNVLNGDYYGQGRLTEKIPSKILIDHEWE